MNKSIKPARLGALTLAALLTACGGGGGSDTGGGSTAPTTPPTTPTGPSDADLALQTNVPAATYVEGSPERVIFDYLNARRGACGFGLLAENSKLNVSAAAHANYVIERSIAGQFEQYLQNAHQEVNGLSGYTGTTIADRQRAAGYVSSAAGGNGGEIAAFGGWGNKVDAMRALLSGPYHLMAAMGSYRDAGISYAESKLPTSDPRSLSTVIIDMGFMSHPQRSNEIRSFPCQGTTDVSTSMAFEMPDPLAPHGLDQTKAGPGIYIAGPYLKKLKVVSASVAPSTGAGTAYTLGVNMIALTQDNDSYIKSWGDQKMNEAVLVPHTKLSSNTTYTVQVTISIDGTESIKNFSFATGER